MKKLVALAGVLAAGIAVAADKDPRETYSTDGWKLTWSEEFNGTGAPDPNVWKAEVGFVRNHEPQYYTNMREENCCQKDGALVITARKEPWQNEFYGKQKSGWQYGIKEAKYTSADIVTKRTFLYGRLEIRARMPNEFGAWPAIWTLGDSLRKPKDDPDYFNWPCSGEIDIVEIWGNNPNRVASCLHTSKIGTKIKPNEQHTCTGGGDRRFDKPGERPSDGFHTYTLDWYEDKMVIFYDGKRYGGASLSRSDWPVEVEVNAELVGKTIKLDERKSGVKAGTKVDEAVLAKLQEKGVKKVWVATKNPENPFRKPHFLLLNLALGGYGNPVYDEDTPQMREKKGPDGKVMKDENGKKIMEPTGKIIPAAKFPMEMKVDWVRYYERESK